MVKPEVALRALLCQAEFEVADRAAELATAVGDREAAHGRAEQARSHTHAVLAEMRRQQQRRAINPVLVTALQQSYGLDLVVERDAQTTLTNAQAIENDRRDALAQQRSRTRGLQDAVSAAVQATAREHLAREALMLEDLWLARHLRGKS